MQVLQEPVAVTAQVSTLAVALALRVSMVQAVLAGCLVAVLNHLVVTLADPRLDLGPLTTPDASTLPP